MTYLKSIARTLKTFTFAAACWLAICGVALAQARDNETQASGGGAWVMSYFLVVLGVVLGLLVVLKTSRRRERAKPEEYGENKLISDD